MYLIGKKIILIAPKYFDYEQEIKKYLENEGALVYLVYENMDRVSFYYKYVHSKYPDKMKEVMYDYFIKKIRRINEKPDVVLVIRGQFVTREALAQMRFLVGQDSRFILYQWDSTENNPNALEIAELFDRVFTFDIEDAKTYGWEYRPLFFIPSKLNVTRKNNIFLYMCSLHSDRAIILKKLKELCEKLGYTYLAYLYEKRYVFFKRKYIDKNKEYRIVDNKDMTFKSVPLEKTYKLYGESKIVVDYTHPGQKGYTMRTIECIGSKCKIVTNNSRIKKADFFNEANVYVYEGVDLDIPQEFIASDYVDLPEDKYNYYALDSWIKIVLGHLYER